MKKILAVVIVAATLLSLFVGCGAEAELSPLQKAQARAVEIGRQYIDFEITGAEAKEMLEAIKVPEEGSLSHDSLRITIKLLAYKVGSQWSTYDEIEELVNDLASQDYSD